MRLTKLKLAGFKSFVDPTTIALPGQLVGVVGPNGCGKSNVMDAVRWVLGESKASELRGESMQDVIFNGSGERKPVSRASVEMIFDNSLGRVGGQWSQYADLSVKRVLTRAGQSEYYINNQHVRRKDVTDLFLGTGLGPRAYAIIGQGMISRIIEARPDELRVFLEEAAGVTKYKERRRETENRIADTRDNLLRVEDIRQELAGQMDRLEAQAAVARQYRQFSEDLVRRQQLLWLLRRNEAQVERERLAAELGRAAADQDERVAALRQTEAVLTATREAVFAASDALQQAQAGLFEANAEVVRLEAEIRHRREARHEYENRLTQLADDREHWREQVDKLAADEKRWRGLAAAAAERVEEESMRVEMLRERLPQAEAAHAAARDLVGRERAGLSALEQRLHVEQANLGHAQRSLLMLAGRRERLQQERAALPTPDADEYALHQEMLGELKLRVSDAQDELAALQQQLPQLEQARRAAFATVQQAQKERADTSARRAALEQLQQRVAGSGDRAGWLRRHHLEGRAPLWKSLHVDAGWEDAVEALLRERLSAIVADQGDAAWAKDRPPARLALLLPRQAAADEADGKADVDAEGAAGAVREPLAAHVHCTDPALAGILANWLADVGSAPDLATALARRAALSGRACIVTPAGDIVSQSGVVLFAPDAGEHGLLERQREIEALARQLDERQAAVEAAQAALAESEAQLLETQQSVQSARARLDHAQDEAHALQVESLKLAQAIERHRERQAQIDQALAEMAEEEEGEQERRFIAEQAIDEVRAQMDDAQALLDAARAAFEDAERRFRDEREQVAGGERELREAQFRERECRNKLDEIAGQQDLAQTQLERIDDEVARCTESVSAQHAEDLEPALQTALAARVAAEHALAAARDAQEAATGRQRELEESRLAIERSLDPLRERIGELRLKEQAAALNAAQLAEQLLESGADEAALLPELAGARANSLQNTINQLQKAIDALGAVNLAALDELEAARERKGYLDAQAEDLTQAMTTLENAIRRIDRETRELLQNTFDSVNASFGELFPRLFGGGEARLIMTGDEILDAGVQVMAQPPGKKNSTIQLLSGGEKALTAIALVFAIFRLNPAPFCLLDEVDAPLDDTNTERFCELVRHMSSQTQFLFISHNKIAMEMAQQLVGVTMQESGVSRIVDVDIAEALRMREQLG
ncbi:chromosome segregation protein SMC [Rhodocyclus tenuis]|uniref:Chromosome partition protein Smc n=2 Tax=Pseudomonadota TaxID=1224 RepID=A0A840G550_RHOTE|nr:chromosome segregation protein SMC [Rhodocyclus tenuis]MBB4247056.1 chromosome segregation protein [Rhodocyclus tenuis]